MDHTVDALAYMAAAYSRREEPRGGRRAGRFLSTITYASVWMAANPGKTALILTLDVDRVFNEASERLPHLKIRKVKDGIELMHKAVVVR